VNSHSSPASVHRKRNVAISAPVLTPVTTSNRGRGLAVDCRHPDSTPHPNAPWASPPEITSTFSGRWCAKAARKSCRSSSSRSPAMVIPALHPRRDPRTETWVAPHTPPEPQQLPPRLTYEKGSPLPCPISLNLASNTLNTFLKSPLDRKMSSNPQKPQSPGPRMIDLKLWGCACDRSVPVLRFVA